MLLGYVLPENKVAATLDKLGIPLILVAIVNPWMIILTLMYCQYDPIRFVFEDLHGKLGGQSASLSGIAFFIRLLINIIGTCECSRILNTVNIYIIVLCSCANRMLVLSKYLLRSPTKFLRLYRVFVVLFHVLVNQIAKPISVIVSSLFCTFVPFWWLIITHHDTSSVFLYLATFELLLNFAFKIALDLFAYWGSEVDHLISKTRQSLREEFCEQRHSFATNRKLKKFNMLLARATRPVRLPYYPFQDIDYQFVADVFNNLLQSISDAVLLTH